LAGLFLYIFTSFCVFRISFGGLDGEYLGHRVFSATFFALGWRISLFQLCVAPYICFCFLSDCVKRDKAKEPLAVWQATSYIYYVLSYAVLQVSGYLT